MENDDLPKFTRWRADEKVAWIEHHLFKNEVMWAEDDLNEGLPRWMSLYQEIVPAYPTIKWVADWLMTGSDYTSKLVQLINNTDDDDYFVCIHNDKNGTACNDPFVAIVDAYEYGIEIKKLAMIEEEI